MDAIAAAVRESLRLVSLNDLSRGNAGRCRLVVDTQQMPKKKSQAIDMPKHDAKQSRKRTVPPKPVVIATKVADVPQDLPQLRSFFENKAGRYELNRVEDGQAFYSFTNHQQRTVDATMPVVTWRKMQERADPALKESA